MKLKGNNPANAFILNPNILEVTLSTKAVEGELKDFCTYEANEQQLKFAKGIERINSAINDLQKKHPKISEYYLNKYKMVEDLTNIDGEPDMNKIIFSQLIS